MSRLVCVPLQEQAPRSGAAQPPAGEPVFIAVDLSKSKWVYCVRWGGQERRHLSTAAELCHLQALVREYASPTLHVVYEACGFGFEIAWWLQAHQIDVLVLAPSTVERAPGRKVKTDRLDAGKMAQKLERGDLKGIYIPPRAAHENRQLTRTYQQMLKDRRRAQVRIRSLLREHGRPGPSPARGWTVYHTWLQTQELPAPVAACVRVLLASRLRADGHVKELKKHILALSQTPAYAMVAALTAQPGVGRFGAMLIMLELVTLKRFRSGHALAHYLGLTPSEYSSGDLVHRGHILRCGPGIVRATLVQCAWRSIRRDHGDTRLRARYDRLQPKTQSKRAIIAVARALAVNLYTRAVGAEAAPTA